MWLSTDRSISQLASLPTHEAYIGNRIVNDGVCFPIFMMWVSVLVCFAPRWRARDLHDPITHRTAQNGCNSGHDIFKSICVIRHCCICMLILLNVIRNDPNDKSGLVLVLAWCYKVLDKRQFADDIFDALSWTTWVFQWVHWAMLTPTVQHMASSFHNVLNHRRYPMESCNR